MTAEDSQPVNQPAVPRGSRNTHFDFQAKVFQAPGAHFELRGHPKKAMFAVDMGAGQGYISLSDLRRTFFIAQGSHDDRLIDRAEAGLHLVPDIRPGDEIPNEVPRRHGLMDRRTQAQADRTRPVAGAADLVGVGQAHHLYEPGRSQEHLGRRGQ